MSFLANLAEVLGKIVFISIVLKICNHVVKQGSSVGERNQIYRFLAGP
jgi:hypothetical protein